MHYLYWIHTSEHTNILSEGYVGVSNNPTKRLRNHKTRIDNPHLTNALKKHSNVILTILLQGPESYCYDIEEKLRPIKEIGWNIIPGGTKPPDSKGKNNPMWGRDRSGKLNPMWGRDRSGKLNPMWGRKRPDITEYNRIRAKTYTFRNPQNDIVQIINMRKFCRENKLDQSAMIAVAKGKNHHHKGWTIAA